VNSLAINILTSYKAVSVEGGVHGTGGCVPGPLLLRQVRKHFPQARIAADRFHVIRIINHPLLNCWREIDPAASKNRGLLSLMRRHRHNLRPNQHSPRSPRLQQNPALEVAYHMKQKLCYLRLEKRRNRRKYLQLALRLPRMIADLRAQGLAQPVQLGIRSIPGEK
jgi:transposase